MTSALRVHQLNVQSWNLRVYSDHLRRQLCNRKEIGFCIVVLQFCCGFERSEKATEVSGLDVLGKQ